MSGALFDVLSGLGIAVRTIPEHYFISARVIRMMLPYNWCRSR